MSAEKKTPGDVHNVPGATTNGDTNQIQSSTPHAAVQHAKAFSAEGFRILPVGADKVPLVDGFGADEPDATWPPYAFAEPFCCVGVLCGPCDAAPEADWLVCVDIDGDPGGNPAMLSWLATLPQTVSTHGGRHLWFWAPARTAGGPCFKRPGVAHDGLDLKSAGGYVRELTADLAAAFDSIAELPAAALAALWEHRGNGGASKKEHGAEVQLSSDPCDGRGEAFLREHGFDPAVVKADAAEWLRTSAPLPTEGTGGATLMVVTGALMVGFALDDVATIELLCDVYAPRAWPDEDPDEAGFAHKIDEIDRHGSEVWETGQLATRARNMRRTAELGIVATEQRAARIEAAGGVDHPEEDTTGCHLSPLTGWPFILQKDRRFWLHRADAAAYRDEITASELVPSVARHLHNQISTLARKDLDEDFVRPVTDVRTSYMSRINTYDPTTDTLTLSALKWMPAERATFHAHIDRWLRALAGDMYPLLAQWLAACTDLTRPAPCLYLAGPAALGKTLLFNGLAKLWGVGAPGKLNEVVSDFNECLTVCPLVFGDEGFPAKITLDWFRDSVTGYEQRVNKKGIQKFSIPGCARYAVAANNLDGFRYLKLGSLTKDDLKGVNDRLLLIECRLEAIAAWKAFDPRAAASHEIAEHVLWLAANVELLPSNDGRGMAAASGGGEKLTAGALINRHSEVLSCLRANLEAGEDAQGREPLVVQPADSPDEMWVSVSRVHQRLVMVPGNKVTLSDVRSFCSSYEVRKPEQHKVNGVNVMWRVLDAARVLATISDLD
jgi:hypothetical protein